MNFRNDSPDTRDFKEAAMTAKESIDKMCELADEMRERYSERGGSYGERYGERGDYGERGYSMRSGYSNRDWDGMDERRYRDSKGRYM